MLIHTKIWSNIKNCKMKYFHVCFSQCFMCVYIWDSSTKLNSQSTVITMSQIHCSAKILYYDKIVLLDKSFLLLYYMVTQLCVHFINVHYKHFDMVKRSRIKMFVHKSKNYEIFKIRIVSKLNNSCIFINNY